MTDKKMRMKDPETGQWVKIWPDRAAAEQKAKLAPANKAKGKAPENKGR